MAILTKEEARRILEKALSYSTADACEISLSGSERGNIRYARNTVSTSGKEENLSLVVSSSFGKKSGVSTINEFDDKSLKKVVKRSEELAKLAPENPEYMPPLGPQDIKESESFKESTANIDPEYRASVAESSINQAVKEGLVAAGFFEHSAGFRSMINSNGLFAYRKGTGMDFTLTVRTADGTGSGWVTRDFNDVEKFDPKETAAIAVKKASMSKSAKALEPGKYTVILEPAASVQLLQNMMYNMSARSADEGRSFLSKKGEEGNKLGEKLVDERVNIYSDPFHPDLPGSTWNGDGMPIRKTDWIKDGKVANMFYSRYWAKQKGAEANPFPGSFIMEGGNEGLEEMIRNTKKGILVTRLWYIRTVDPATLLYTGLTRDGTFYIENGQIKFPVKNFRFNESPIIMLNNLEALGKQQRVEGNLVPPMKIRDFTFTSLSDAV